MSSASSGRTGRSWSLDGGDARLAVEYAHRSHQLLAGFTSNTQITAHMRPHRYLAYMEKPLCQTLYSVESLSAKDEPALVHMFTDMLEDFHRKEPRIFEAATEDVILHVFREVRPRPLTTLCASRTMCASLPPAIAACGVRAGSQQRQQGE